MRVLGIVSGPCHTWNSPRKLGKEAEGIENQRRNQDDTDHSIVKLGYNAQKSLGDLRGLAFTPTPVKNHQ